MIYNPVAYPEPEHRRLHDSDLNILRSLAHEADEPCCVCGDMVSPQPCNPPGSFEWPNELAGQPCCEECGP